MTIRSYLHHRYPTYAIDFICSRRPRSIKADGSYFLHTASAFLPLILLSSLPDSLHGLERTRLAASFPSPTLPFHPSTFVHMLDHQIYRISSRSLLLSYHPSPPTSWARLSSLHPSCLSSAAPLFPPPTLLYPSHPILTPPHHLSLIHI